MEKERYLKKSDSEYIEEIANFIARRSEININELYRKLKFSPEIKILINNFKNTIKEIQVVEDIRKAKIKLHQEAQKIIEGKDNT